MFFQMFFYFSVCASACVCLTYFLIYGRVYFVSVGKGIDQGNFWGMRFVRRGHPKFGKKKLPWRDLPWKRGEKKKWGISQGAGSKFSWFEHGMNNLVPYSKQSTYLATPERSKGVQEAGNTVFDEKDQKKYEAPKKKNMTFQKFKNVSHGHFPWSETPIPPSKMYQQIIPDNSRPIAPGITWINAPRLQFFNFFRKKIRKKCISDRPTVRPTDRLSVRPTVRPSDRPSVRLSVWPAGGDTIWLCHMALPYGSAIWPCHMALPHGMFILSVWERVYIYTIPI